MPLTTYVPLITSDDNNFLTRQGYTFRVRDRQPVDIGDTSIWLYYTRSENNRLDKLLLNPNERVGTLREGTSMVSPVITIWSDYTLKYNYAYIPDFGRYYYITDIIAVKNNLYELHLAVDVLMTYRQGIGSSTARVLRSEYEIDTNLTDVLNPPKAAETVTLLTSSVNNSDQWVRPPAGSSATYLGYGHLVAKIAYTARYESITSITSYKKTTCGWGYITCSFDGLATIIKRVLDLGVFTHAYELSEIIKEVYWTPIPFVVGSRVYGLGFSPVYNDSMPPLDLIEIDDINNTFIDGVALNIKRNLTWRYTQNLRKITVNGQTSVCRYRNVAPFAALNILFTPFGSFSAPTEIFGNASKLEVVLEADMPSGNAYLWLKDADRPGNIMLLGSSNIFYPVQYDVTGDNTKAIASAIMSSATSAITQPTPAAIIGGVGNVISAASSVASIPPCGTSGTNHATMMDAPRVYRVVKEQDEVDPSRQGYLLNKPRQLNRTRGYIKTSDIHLEGDGLGTATKPERDEIISLLSQGVIAPYNGW